MRILKTIVLTLLVGVGGCGALILGAWLYQKTQTVDMTLHYDLTGTMTELDEVDARWNEDVLKSRLRLNKNYDPLVNAMVAQNDLGQRLTSTLQDVAANDTHVLSSLKVYQATIKTKLDLVEQFKSQNSILRNSTEYIAFSIHKLSDMIQQVKTDPSAPVESLNALKQHLHELTVGLLEYTSESYAPEFVANQIEALEGFLQQKSFPDTIHEFLTLVLSHVRNVLHKKPIVDNLLTTLISLPTATNLNDVRVAYSDLHRQRLGQTKTYQILFFSYITLFAIGIVYLVLYRHLLNKRRIQLLTTANEDLEKQVALSQELAKTYDELDRSKMLLIQSEKMSALGQMVAGVAHEINTPLAYSRSNVALAQEQLPTLMTLVEESVRQAELLDAPESADEVLSEKFATVAELAKSLHQEDIVTEMDELLQASVSGLDRISEMVLSLKNFSRLDRKKVDLLNLNEGLDSALVIGQNTLKHKVEIIKNYGEIPPITCSPSQINQVFLNILMNAAQAIEDHGTITLTTLAKGKQVEVSIEDNGPGIPEDVLPNIFDPFYTTKGIGEGTGLGLAISYQIIEQHGGTIEVQTEVGSGTRFVITLPVIHEEEPAATEALVSSQVG